MFTFCWGNKSLIGQSTKISQLKLVLRSWKKSKQSLVKKTFGDPQNFGDSDPTNELYELFIPFFIWSKKLRKYQKYYVIMFVYFFYWARQDGQDRNLKWKQITQLKWPKYEKKKLQKWNEPNNWPVNCTIFSYFTLHFICG